MNLRRRLYTIVFLSKSKPGRRFDLMLYIFFHLKEISYFVDSAGKREILPRQVKFLYLWSK